MKSRFDRSSCASFHSGNGSQIEILNKAHQQLCEDTWESGALTMVSEVGAATYYLLAPA